MCVLGGGPGDPSLGIKGVGRGAGAGAGAGALQKDGRECELAAVDAARVLEVFLEGSDLCVLRGAVSECGTSEASAKSDQVQR